MTERKLQRRYVDEVARDLFGPLLGPRPRSLWKLVGWDAEQGLSLTMQKGDAIVLIELEVRDDEKDCYARTGRFNICARRTFDYANRLNSEERLMVDAVVDLIAKRESRLPEIERSATGRTRSVREIEVERLLIPEGRGHYYLNPYVGCTIGCPFCYVAERADLSRALEGLPRLPWGRYLDVKVNAADVLRREVKEHPPGMVRISPILTDPYQPVERKFRITRQCLEILLDAGYAVAVLTRAGRILDDLDLLRRFPEAMVGFSIPTDQDRYRQLFEPGADPIEDRLEALEACHRAGLFTTVFIQPLLPMDPVRLAKKVAPLVKAVRIDRMYALHTVQHLYELHALDSMATDAYFSSTLQSLRERFLQRGVWIDEMDDLAGLIRRDRA